MIQVTKEQMRKLREQFPGIRATRTVHKYYIEENPKYCQFIKNGCRREERQHA